MSPFDVIIIGGGASGLMCAMQAGQRGRRVLVLDRSNRVGKKILMSGGGRCNFMNLAVTRDNFLSANPHFCISALKRYTQWDFLALVDKHAIAWHERKHGQLFCNDSAKDILNLLLSECADAGVEIRSSCEIVSVEALVDQPQRFAVHTSLGQFRAESLVVATGGLSIPTMGASGFGYDLARQFGHSLLPTRAGLVPFMFSDGFKAISERLSGLASEVVLENPRASFTENILFTHRGLSGPAALQLSNYWLPGESLQVNLFPGEDLPAWLLERKKSQPRSLLRSLLGERLARSLVEELQALFWPAHAETPMAEIPDAVLAQIAGHLSGWELRPSSTEGYRTAEVTLGGVNTDEVSSKTMESKLQPGLYFIGEVLDVTGHLGGFNFQWAWSSGHAAGQVV
ncbi:NAD(P)/FAD-dependent oxidoreductase [Pseudomonas sp. N040]|uniref:NAD(P)/FAD-dependent oxidoreductase n=1 Tax=Pseudomonas sp. N040 TaxID=2785325 RepID=UPI0018A2DC13|nr:NAD(P)/FAD-dependent oxidoreductase [Pseudomonas sp. N040]MBF7731088.1 NAD(P)/FAD-dependent oxidoreductase [Pseudomonas sp. N040]